MTRKGETQRPWTTRDVQYLKDNAGKMSVPEISRHLGRTARSVINQANRQGLSLRYTLIWCDYCARWRTKLDRDGRCPVCLLKERLERYQGVAGPSKKHSLHARRARGIEHLARRDQETEEKQLTRAIEKARKHTERHKKHKRGDVKTKQK